MESYERPRIDELGTIAQFTQKDEWNLDFDGNIWQVLSQLAHGQPVGSATS